ncbi:MAG: hypothetical protein AAF199_10360, partial [Pseudomonadota bacterium]
MGANNQVSQPVRARSKRRLLRVGVLALTGLIMSAGAVPVWAPFAETLTPRAAAQEADSAKITLEHYLDWERAGAPKFSPAGNSIIYTRRQIDKFTDKWSSELWQMDANGGRHRFLTKGANVQWA